ncbi:hypothetical protein A2950_02175 [Candidatus Kaiserbacteria bacterium RIFCSPLOWO2_01_FULL_55_19]|uniref:Tryptophan synthase beta chain-like PALP domain-containing protein n=1 Tax=Candidatus Kaiserbacteria bacterium RIFCSPLOWO2_01_FULL_55_19 TaxID=1798516 RepID=A0A1F6ESD6_9BACT|nr:MAG: hypothetical protein A2950_02175 [Candidatus Kaiserbacteria bacterium RIFCSPLOWO2_01_FULL_55_19]
MVHTESDILLNPVVQALNPYEHNFIAVRWLSSRLNPYKNSHNIEIGAAIAFMGLPHIKAVAVFGMMMEDYRSGLYEGINTLVVPSSGNTGHGAALLARAFGIPHVRVIMSSDTPEAKQSIIKMLPWASVITPDATQSVESRALEEATNRPGNYLLDQYKHRANARIHAECTGPKLLHAAGGSLGLVAVAMGSGGTVTGVSVYLKRIDPDVIMLGVRPKQGERVPGVRDAKQMEEVVTLPYKSAVDAIAEVGRKESFLKTRALLSEIQPQPGPSSGLAYVGLLQYLAQSPDVLELLRGKSAVFVCSDDGRFYPAPTAAELDPDE